jgi:NAD(P)-dependent dehydrogenase (short-subunit alcohol dehydrogenase family)
MNSDVAVITGGAGGMGLATAKLLGAGWHLVIADVNAARLEQAAGELRALGFACTPVVCDISDRASVEALVVTASSLGRVASVVHTAGVSPQMGSPEFIARINALGTVYLTEAFLQRATEGFTMVNVASIAGHLLPAFFAPVRRTR